MTDRWEVRQDPRDPNAWDVYCGVQKIAHLPWLQKAHADLIAAAPELLKVLIEARKWMDGDVMHDPWEKAFTERIDQAIAKAEGTK